MTHSSIVEPSGTPADIDLEEFSTGFFAFMRLIGTVYFKKYDTIF